MSVFRQDIGTKIILDTKQDLTTATDQKICLLFGGVDQGEQAAVVETPATGGKISITKSADILNQVGKWTLHSKIYFGTDVYIGEAVTLDIKDKG